MDNGIIEIHGKDYHTVSKRVNDFRSEHGLKFGITTEILHIDEKSVVVKASIIDEEGYVLSSGLAEEKRTSSNINKESALENCETSAVGRALAFFGYAGTEIASADEMMKRKRSEKVIDEEQLANLDGLINEVGAELKGFFAYFGIPTLADLPAKKYEQAVKMLEAKR